jgi:hypothetical protein
MPSHTHTRAQWWVRFLQAYDTLENVVETHLLHQVFPVVVALAETAFAETGQNEHNEDPAETAGTATAGAGVGAGAGCSRSRLPAPSPRWAEVLIQRSLSGHNNAVQRVYLRWIFAQARGGPVEGAAATTAAVSAASSSDQQLVLDVCRLSEGFVLGRLLPALHEINQIREDREELLQDIGRFLATYTVGQQARRGAEGVRYFLRALLSLARDAVKDSLVRMALLGCFVEQHAVLERVQPCFGALELDLARSALVLFLSENNQAVGHRLADCVLACCEHFTDGGGAMAAAAPAVVESVRALLLELPVTLSLHAWSNRIRRWLEKLGGEAGAELAWWRDATARGVEALCAQDAAGGCFGRREKREEMMCTFLLVKPIMLLLP